MTFRLTPGLSLLTLTLCASTALAQAPTHGADLSHTVHFQIGETRLLPGDTITIDEIHGTSEKIEPGNLYEVKGRYILGTQPDATLAISVTGTEPSGGHDQWLKVQRTKVDQGAGAFTLYFYMFSPGSPHLSFYPTNGGQSFASVYFLTGDPFKAHAVPVASPPEKQ